MSQPSRVIPQGFETKSVGGNQGSNPVDLNFVATCILVEAASASGLTFPTVTIGTENANFTARVGVAYRFERPLTIKRISTSESNGIITLTYGDGMIGSGAGASAALTLGTPAVNAISMIAFPGGNLSAVTSPLIPTDSSVVGPSGWLQTPAGFRGMRLKFLLTVIANPGSFISAYIQAAVPPTASANPGAFYDLGWIEKIASLAPHYYAIEVYPGLLTQTLSHDGTNVGTGGLDQSLSDVAQFGNTLPSFVRPIIYMFGGGVATFQEVTYEWLP